jgi:beta-galactosidase/beta-glucuronidase
VTSTTPERDLHRLDPAPLDMEYPRPQLVRDRWTDLSGTWQFGYDDAETGLDAHWYELADLADRGVFDRDIRVPYPPESPASGVTERGYHRVVWYRRTFERADAGDGAGERVVLRFGAVDYRGTVWVNGRLVAEHEGGHTPFAADVTDVLTAGGPQLVVVRAEDDPRDLTQPRGKQDWRERPHAIWYERTTGIWQPVWLEPLPATHVAALTFTPDLDRSILRVRVRLGGWRDGHLDRGTSAGPRLRVRLTLHGELLADDVWAATGQVIQRDVPLDGARIHHDRWRYLWTPENPNLIDAEVAVVGGDQEVLDVVRSYCGLRSVSAEGRQFALNGRGYPLRLVLAQNYWPETHLAARDGKALRREVELVKELGFNGVRIHQKVEDPRFLAWCDQLGLLAWGEMPSALDFGPRTVRRITHEWLEVIERDVSSPALVAWVPFNESWGVPNLEHDERQRHAVQALYHLTRAIDPTRPVVGNDGWENLVADVLGVHDYSQSGEVLRERYGSWEAFERTRERVRPYFRRIALPGLPEAGQPLVVSEFGGITYDPGREDFWNGYGAAESAEEFLARYRELVSALLDSPAVAGFCYTQLTDTAQERNGLLTEDRVPKVDAARIAAVNRAPAASSPGQTQEEIQIVHAARRRSRSGDPMP